MTAMVFGAFLRGPVIIFVHIGLDYTCISAFTSSGTLSR